MGDAGQGIRRHGPVCPWEELPVRLSLETLKDSEKKSALYNAKMTEPLSFPHAVLGVLAFLSKTYANAKGASTS